MLQHSRSLFTLTLLTACTITDAAPGSGAGESSASPGASASGEQPTTTTTTPDGDTTSTDATTTAAATTTTTAATTGTADAATSTTGDTTGPPLRCGDGTLDPGETCDAGHGVNADDGACTLACQTAVCGDGLVWKDHEACDAGNNNDGKYGGCLPDCSLAAHCGDGEKNGPEECDLGEDNGTDEHLIDGVPCSATCYHSALTVFLSSTAFAPSELYHASGADKRCQELAIAAGIYGGAPFKAWISDGGSDPASRFEPAIAGMPYALRNGKRIAKDRAALLADGPEDGITMTEEGVTLYNVYVWTHTTPAGTNVIGGDHCESWTKDSPLWKGDVGHSGVDKQDLAAWQTWKTGQYWTTFATFGCNLKYYLYCVEQ